MRHPILAGLVPLFALMSISAYAVSGGKLEFNRQSGFIECTLTTEYQTGPTLVQILLPDKFDPQRKYPVLYILPVEVDNGSEFGNGLMEAKKADVANKYGVICVYPTFTKVFPWYGNHATDPRIRQDDYVVKALVPFIDKSYSTQQNEEGRWLIGFSKSGWGAYTLLFRHPDVFGYAAAWDVPFMLSGNGKNWGPMGLSANFGTKEAMQQSLPTRLAVDNATWLKKRCRLVLGVGIAWTNQTNQMDGLLQTLGIPHVYRIDLTLPHRWDSGWFPPMIEELVKIARAS